MTNTPAPTASTTLTVNVPMHEVANTLPGSPDAIVRGVETCARRLLQPANGEKVLPGTFTLEVRYEGHRGYDVVGQVRGYDVVGQVQTEVPEDLT